MASAKRHHQGAGRFQPQVIGQPAHPQLVVKAVDDDVARSQARRRLRASGYLGLQLCIMGRQCKIHRLARSTRGAVQPGHAIPGVGEVAAKGRIRRLIGTQLLLVGKGHLGNVC